jgi:hypothetical protein
MSLMAGPTRPDVDNISLPLSLDAHDAQEQGVVLLKA